MLAHLTPYDIAYVRQDTDTLQFPHRVVAPSAAAAVFAPRLPGWMIPALEDETPYEIACAMQIDVSEILRYNLAWIPNLQAHAHLFRDTIIRIPEKQSSEHGSDAATSASAGAGGGAASGAASSPAPEQRTSWFAGGRGRSKSSAKKAKRKSSRSEVTLYGHALRTRLEVKGRVYVIAHPARSRPYHPAEELAEETVMWVAYHGDWFLAQAIAFKTNEIGELSYRLCWLVDGLDERWCVLSFVHSLYVHAYLPSL